MKFKIEENEENVLHVRVSEDGDDVNIYVNNSLIGYFDGEDEELFVFEYTLGKLGLTLES